MRRMSQAERVRVTKPGGGRTVPMRDRDRSLGHQNVLEAERRQRGGRSRPAAACVHAKAPVSASCAGKPLDGFKHCCAALRFTKTPLAASQRKGFRPLPGAVVRRRRKHPPLTSWSWKSEFQVRAGWHLLRPPWGVDGRVSSRGPSSVRVCPHLLLKGHRSRGTRAHPDDLVLTRFSQEFPLNKVPF